MAVERVPSRATWPPTWLRPDAQPADEPVQSPPPARDDALTGLDPSVSVQADEKSGVPPPGVLTKPTKPPLRGENPGDLPPPGTDKTDETPTSAPTPDPGDWPESWVADFDAMKAENIRIGHAPGEAAGLAFLNLKARAACPWREEIARWPERRRELWGRRAGAMQDSGVDWRTSEERAFDEIDGHPQTSSEPNGGRR